MLFFCRTEKHHRQIHQHRDFTRNNITQHFHKGAQFYRPGDESKIKKNRSRCESDWVLCFGLSCGPQMHSNKELYWPWLLNTHTHTRVYWTAPLGNRDPALNSRELTAGICIPRPRVHIPAPHFSFLSRTSPSFSLDLSQKLMNRLHRRHGGCTPPDTNIAL